MIHRTALLLMMVGILTGIGLGVAFLAGSAGDADAAPALPAVSTPIAFSKVAVGDYHACAIAAGGADVYCWGRNHNGQLGDGTTMTRTYPVKVQGLGGLTMMDITAGQDHTCVRILTGGMRCWGYAANGQLGFGIWSSQYYTTPQTVSGISAGIGSIDGGNNNTCAVVSGAAYCWGSNEGGQIGNGSMPTGANTPAAVNGLNGGVTDISISLDFACASVDVGLNDAVRCWGRNQLGQLGTGVTSTTPISVPVAVNGLDAFPSIASVGAGNYHACVLYTGGTVDCWGGGAFGQLGNGTSPYYTTTVVSVSGLPLSSQMSVGPNTSCVRTNAGVAHCWGYGTNGQLGNGLGSSSNVPVPVSGLGSGVQQISVGFYNACAVMSGGGIKCWGSNEHGQLGNGTFQDSLVPTAVLTVRAYLPAIRR